jgi:hypothetical protein
MKNVTDAFKAAQASPSSVSLRRVSYKRRYWQQSTQSYIWETNWTALSESEVVSVSAITAKLDTEAVNEFKISNLTITLKNQDRRWTPTNPFGRFGKDAASPLYGYEPFWTKFRIETGYVVNGVDTFVPLFVGVAVDFQTAGHSDTMQVSVHGIEELLKNANAELAGVLVENETPTGNIDGTNNVFQTIQPGVGIVLKVVVNGIENNAGTDYTVESFDDPNSPAVLTFEIPPTTGQTVKVDYIYWKQQQNIDDAVKDILEASGFNSSQYAVDPVTFISQFKKTISFDSQTDWESGTLTLADTTSFSGSLGINPQSSIVDDFSDGNYTANLAWTVDFQSNCTLTVPGSYLRVTSTSTNATAKIHASNPSGAKDYGEYACVFIPNQQMDFNFKMALSNTTTTGGGSAAPGIVIDLRNRPLENKLTVSIYGYTENQTPDSFVLYDYPAWYNDRIKIMWRRWFDGTVKVYFGIDTNPGLVWTGNHNGYTNINYMFLVAQPNGGSGTFIDITDIRMPGSNYGGNWVSPTIDFVSTPTSYLPMIISDRKYNSSTITYQTRTSTDGVSWSSWATTGSGFSISSPLRRYIQIKIYLDATYAFNFVDRLTIQAYINQTKLKLSKYTARKSYDAIKSLASFANYEWGFGTDEIFFFRPKSVSDSIDQVLDSSINIIDVGSINNGETKVYDEVKAEYGAFVATATAGTGHPLSPSHRYGNRRMEVSNGDILINEDTDIATGIALGLINYYSKPRRTCKAKTKLMEWVDLSDTVSVTYRDQPNNWWMGDTHVYLGQTDIHLHGPEANTLDGFLAKVVGYRHDTESKTSEFDLEEILQ